MIIRRHWKWMSWLAVIAVVVARPVAAEDLRAVRNLMATGKTENLEQAVVLLDKHLATDNKDFRPRYLKSIALIDLGKYREAIEYIDILLREYPKMAELYNNRGIAYSGLKEYAKAMQSFDEAIRLKPDYPLAHENIGLLYISLAEIAIDHAKRQDQGNARLTELHSLLQLLNSENRTAVSTGINAVPKVGAPKFIDEPPKIAETPKSEARPSPSPASPSVPNAPSAPDPRWGAVIKTIKSWQSAWETKNVDGYLAAYSLAFKPSSARMTRKDWEAERVREIVGRSNPIKIRMRDMDVAFPDANTAEVHFDQVLQSAGPERVESKILLLTNDHGRWLIEEERTLPK